MLCLSTSMGRGHVSKEVVQGVCCVDFSRVDIGLAVLLLLWLLTCGMDVPAAVFQLV